MFNKKDTHTHEAGLPPAQTKRSVMKSQAPSILSSDLVITGSIVSDGEVQLDGQVNGDVRAGTLTIGEEASVSGEVMADSVVIRGRVEGSVRARQVQLASTARIEGDIVHATLAIESGAYFDGHCRRDSDPLSDKPAQSKSSASPGGSASKPQSSQSSPPSAPPAPKAASSSSGSSMFDEDKPKAAANADPFKS